MKILVVEDNEILSRNLVRFLATQNIQAQASLDWVDAEFQASTKYFDAIVLDIQLPKQDGLRVCKSLREKGNTTPIIMLTSRGTNDDIVQGLELGADDYLVKPFEYSELLARLRALTRRNLKNKSNTLITISALQIDLEKHEVLFQENPIDLSEKEFELLKYLAQNKGVALSREQIYERVWWESCNDFTAGKTLDVYIGYLRKKLAKDIIQTKKGYGYIIV